MKQMLMLALAGLKSRRRTSLLLLTAVVFSVVFLTVMGLIGSSAVYTVDRQKKELYGEQKVTVWNLTADEAETILKDARWERTGRFDLSGAVADAQGELYGLGTADSEALALGHIRLTAGRMPQQPGEIAAEISALRDYIDHHLKVEGDLRREVSMNIIRHLHRRRSGGQLHRRVAQPAYLVFRRGAPASPAFLFRRSAAGGGAVR